jgi:hypothetical protein
MLIVSDCTDSLLAHSTLVRISRRLIVMRVRNEARTHAQHRERRNFKMRRSARDDFRLPCRDKTVIFFIHVYVFNETRFNEIAPR